MRVIFAGTPDIAIPTLEALIKAGHEVVGVVTQPDARGKRGSTLIPSPVKVWATEQGLAVFTPENASAPEFVQVVRELDADVAVVVAYGQLLKKDLRAAVRLGWLNLHFSLLPAWRGAAPVQRSLMSGDDFTGTSVFLIEAGMDTGPVLGVLTERIRPNDTSGALLSRLAEAGAPLAVECVAAYGRGAINPVPQDSDGISHAPKLTRDDARVPWDRPSHIVDRVIRGCLPAPGPWSTLPDGSTIKIGQVSVVEEARATTPGQIFEVDGDVLVGTGTGAVKLSTVQPAGKKEMKATDWWRGARLSEGSILGEA